jgi:hypothetical protein
VKLIALTGWRCLNCGHMTSHGFPVMSCCAEPVHLRVLVNDHRLTDEERAAITAARQDLVEPDDTDLVQEELVHAA